MDREAPGASGWQENVTHVHISIIQDAWVESMNIGDPDTQGRGETGSNPSNCLTDL